MAKAEAANRHMRKKLKRSPVGASPGTLIADPEAHRSELRLTLIAPDRCEEISNASLKEVVANRGKWPLVWLDCVGLANIELIEGIGRIFDLHPLALEDVVNTGQRPKVDFFDDNAFVVMRMVDQPATCRFEQISLFVGAGFVVTFQEREGDPFDPVRKRIRSSTPNLRSRGSDYLAYALIDAIVDSFFPLVESASEATDSIEDEMLRHARKEQVQLLHEHRRRAGLIQRTLWSLRDAVAGLLRNEAGYIAAETKVYLNDTLDHTIRLIELVDTQRDMTTGLIEMHLSLSQAHTNEIISLLTIVSAIFIPLTFLVGVWGMNFSPDASPWNMPELHSYYGYPIALALMAAVAGGMLAFFKWKKWL